MPMQKTARFLFVYFVLGSVFAPMTMLWLNTCHLCPIVKDCVIYGVMLTITAVSLAIAINWRHER